MDVEALIARADISARQGNRELAIRILGSVVDVRPGDVGAIERLARLQRWQGDRELSCRFSVAAAEFRPLDTLALARAVRCSRDVGETELASRLLNAAGDSIRRNAESELKHNVPNDTLAGDLRLDARWHGDVDVDLALLHPDGHRISWLGAPSRSVITATDVTSHEREGLALKNAKPGEYVIEVTRGRGTGSAHGTITVTVAGTTREIPFELDGDQQAVGIAWLKSVTRLVRAYW
jgi:hypothetical protein